MKYKISVKRAAFLQEKFSEYSFKRIDLDINTLCQIYEPIELNFIAKNHNYDDGNEILFHIINNPYCDFSTAKMIFFRSDLDGFLKTKEESGDFKLISTILQNQINKHYTNENFYYNPTEDSEVVEFGTDVAKSIFPSAFFGKPNGKKIEPDFAENFRKRNISTLKEKVTIQKRSDHLRVSSKSVNFEFDFPENFKTIFDAEIDKFIEHINFQLTFMKNLGFQKIDLRKLS